MLFSPFWARLDVVPRRLFASTSGGPVHARQKELFPCALGVLVDGCMLFTTQERLKGRNYYIALDIFRADFQQMFKNCRLYNASDTVYYRLANRLEGFLDDLLVTTVLYD